MKILNKIHIFVFLIFVFGILLSTYGLNGFLQGHLGWVGPHLYSVSINLEITKFFLADGIYEDSTFHLYNHHPPLFFYIFYFISKLGNSLSEKLQFAYFFAALIYSLSWYFIYSLLKYFGFNKKTSLLVIMLVCSADIFTSYRLVLSFDILSIFVSGSLIYAFYIFDNHTNRNKKELLLAFVFCFISTQISYYSFFIIFSGFVILLFKKIYLKQEFQRLMLYGIVNASFIFLSIVRIPFTFLFMDDKSLTVKNFLSRALGDGMIPKNTNIESISSYLFEKYTHQLLMLIPDSKIIIIFIILISMFLIFSSKDKSQTNHAQTKYDNSIIIPVTIPFFGVLLFYLISPFWAATHPFAILLLSGPIVFCLCIFLQKIVFSEKLITISLIAVSVLLFANFIDERKSNINQINKSFQLISLFEHNFPSGYAFQRFSGSCGILNGGMFKYLTSHPNRWIAPNSNFDDDFKINIECIDKEKGILKINNKSNKIIYYFNKKGQLISK